MHPGGTDHGYLDRAISSARSPRPRRGPRFPSRGAVALASAFGCLAAASRATAQEDAPVRGPAYRLSFDVDAPALLLGGALASSFFEMSEHAAPACAPRCDRSNVNAFARGARGPL